MTNNINSNKIPQELTAKAQKCETAEELVALAKESGVALTKDEAEAYLAEFSVIDIDDEKMKAAAGGVNGCTGHCERGYARK